jgi:hypothetical protein
MQNVTGRGGARYITNVFERFVTSIWRIADDRLDELRARGLDSFPA